MSTGREGSAVLDDQGLADILRLLSARDLASAASVSRQWRRVVDAEGLWEVRVHKDFGQDVGRRAMHGPPPMYETGLPSWKAVWAAWAEALLIPGKGLTTPLEERLCSVRLICGCIYRLRRVLESIGLPAIVRSLKRGVGRETLDTYERALEIKLPAGLRSLWSAVDGQLLLFDSARNLHGGVPQMGQFGTPDPSLFHGLFGAYAFYDHLVSTRFLDVATSMRDTRRLCRAWHTPAEWVLIGSSINDAKTIWVDTELESVWIGPCRDGRFMNACPGGKFEDWFCRFVRCLEAREIGAEPISMEYEDQRRRGGDMNSAGCSTGLCLYLHGTVDGLPQYPRDPFTGSISWVAVDPAVEYCCSSEWTTRGIRVQARPLLIPEFCREGTMFYSYSIRLELLRESPVERCQLLGRHWVIRGPNGEVRDEVSGEGVVGCFPVLSRPGLVTESPRISASFNYQSCIEMRREMRRTVEPNPAVLLGHVAGTMSGWLEFLEGTQERPTGPVFRVQIAEFVMRESISFVI